MPSKAWAGETWIGGVVAAGGAAIALLSFASEEGVSIRAAVIGVALLSAGVGTVAHGRCATKVERCAQCTNVLSPEAGWTRCSVCGAALHAGCSQMHVSVYHPEARGAGPYRGPD
jgi:hypothetical protein